MKINSSTVLVGDKVVLIPYKEEHVPKYSYIVTQVIVTRERWYHDWMQSAELLEQTASDRLTLKEEYEMQRSWYEDENKCTFIILVKRKWLEPHQGEFDSMVGDVNLFFNDTEESKTAELEVMIAEHSFRRCGLGKEAVLVMMHYGVEKLNVHKFRAKIGYNNKPSLNLFGNLGFSPAHDGCTMNEKFSIPQEAKLSEVSTSDVFQEVTLELQVTETFHRKLGNLTCHVTEHNYPYKMVS